MPELQPLTDDTAATVPVFETLEPRLLYSADLAPAGWLGDTALQRRVDDGDAPLAPDDAQRYRIVFADARVEAADPRLAGALADGAAAPDLVRIDPDEDGLARIAGVLRQQPADAWQAVPHLGDDGQPRLGRTDPARLAATELVFVDAGIDGADALVADLQAQAAAGRRIEVVSIARDADGLAAITAALAGRQDIAAVHVIAHGSAGALQLGATTVDARTLQQRAGEIEGWRDALTADADLLLYGCDVAEGARGEAFVDRLAALTGADVAASTDLTGSAARGGDWTLEYTRGQIEATLAIDAAGQAAFDGLLATYTVTNINNSGAGSLRQAITDANGNAGTDNIVFNIAGTGVHTIALASGLPTITDAVIIDATTDDSFAANGGKPAIVLNGGGIGPGNIFNLSGSGGSTIRGFLMTGWSTGTGIYIAPNSDGNTIVGNYIGSLDTNGNLKPAVTSGEGLEIRGSNNVIGGSTAADRNVIAVNKASSFNLIINGLSGAGTGSGNIVKGNYIGTDATGTAVLNASLTASVGIQQTNGSNGSANNIIGGAGAGEGNVIATTGSYGGVWIYTAGTGNVVQGNRIGVSATGTLLTAGNNGVYLQSLTSGSVLDNWVAGGTDTTGSIYLQSVSGATVQGNRIGTDLAGTANWGAKYHGINLVSSSNNLIGGTGAGQGNIVAYSNQIAGSYDGIYVGTGSTGNALLRNSIYGTVGAGLGIDLGTTGITANDVGDADTGANNLQNFPVLTFASTDGSNNVNVAGTLNSTANSYYRIELFASATANASGNGEGQIYLGAVNVATNASGNASFSTTLTGIAVPANYVVSATATKSNAAYSAFTDTSEFAKNAVAVSGVQATLVVDTTADTLDGDTTSLSTLLASKGADGKISLREAILATNNSANGTGGADRITFQIAGTGVHTITLSSVLPAITDAVILDARTDDSFAANGSRPAVVLDVAGIAGYGLQLSNTADGSEVRGLVIWNFLSFAGSGGIQIDAGSNGNTIAGNYIGNVGTDGNYAAGRGTGNAILVAGANNTIGGTSVADRNVIGTTAQTAVRMDGAGASGNVVQGNYLGVNATGTAAFAMNGTGVHDYQTAGGNFILDNVYASPTYYGVVVTQTSTQTTISGNKIGVRPDGGAGLGASSASNGGIYLDGADNQRVTNNWIANVRNGIVLQNGANANVIQGNRIGTDLAGAANWGTGASGITVSLSNDNLIGGTGGGQGNIVANSNQIGSTSDGIAIDANSSGNAILRNSIYGTVAGTSGLGIDLGTSGVTVNDAGDADTGANNLQNFPVLTVAKTDGSSQITIAGTLDSGASSHYRIELFANPAADSSGYGEGQIYLGFVNVATDASGHASFSTTLAAAVPAGYVISATATRSNAAYNAFTDTSEFAQSIVAISSVQNTFVVDTTADTLDGDTTSLSTLLASKGADGRISLREALLAANNTANGSGGADRISFQIAGTSVHTITLASALPTISDAVILDGTTDDSFAANGGLPAIVIDGNQLNADGLVLGATADGSTVRGFVIRNFGGSGIHVDAGSDGHVIAGNLIGRFAADGTDAGGSLGNGAQGIYLLGSGSVIGGTSAADRNVIGGNAGSGILLAGNASGNTVIGNYVGTDASGVAVLSNGDGAIYFINAASGNTVGGATAAQRNILTTAAALASTVTLAGEDVDNNTIVGNWIGLGADGTTVFAGSSQGIHVNGGADGTRIGGSNPGEGNVIVGVQWSGIRIEGTSTGSVIRGNFIGTDSTRTIAGGVGADGIGLSDGAHDNLIGGTGANDGNVIVGGSFSGIFLYPTAGTGNALLGNLVFGHATQPGIDLSNTGTTDGPTANDAGDADTGPNNLQNFPVLTVARTDGSGLVSVSGTFNSTANSHFRIELFASTSVNASGYGEGQTYLGFVNVATDASGNASFSTTLSANVPAGAFVSATATKSNAAYDTFTDTSEFARSIVAISTVQNTVVVDTTADTLDGDTTSLSTLLASKGADGRISLREAILAANNTANGSGGADRIAFQIAGTGVHTITLATALPTITDTVTIDGSTDDSFAANGSRPAIVLHGNGAVMYGVTLGGTADGSTVRGLILKGFTNVAILVGPGSDGNTIAGNYIGALLPDGSYDSAGSSATHFGIVVSGGSNNLIGGATAADRNVLTGLDATGAAIQFQSNATGNRVVGNYIGTTAAGVPAGVATDGIVLASGSQNNTIGGVNAGEGNLIAGNGYNGVFLAGANISGNAILGNSIYGNGDLGIDLGYDGVTANDAGDADSGANDLQNFPVLALAQTDGSGHITISGTLDSTANSWFRIELFANAAADPSGHGEGQTYLGFVNVATDASGHATFSTTLAATVPAGTFISATATKSNAAYNAFTNTSEFAQNIVAAENSLVVDTTDDTLDGDTSSLAALIANKGADGRISLREALLAANNTANSGTPDRITFRIAGTGVHTITLASALPAITDAVILDATTDDSFAANGGKPAIVIDGNGGNFDALQLASGSGGSTVRGLVIRNVQGDGIQIDAGSDGNTIAGNFIGSLTADGSSHANGIGGAGIYVQGAGNFLGGATSADGNLLSGNHNGIVISGGAATGNQVIGNRIGTDLAGTAAIGNLYDGVRIENGATGNTIGGGTAALRNVISGNGGDGVEIGDETSDGNIVQGNWIGVTADGAAALGNGGDGIFIANGADETVVGGPGANDGNWIARPGLVGIEIDGDSSGTLVQGNRIGTDLAGTANWGSQQTGILLENAFNPPAGPSGNRIFDNIVAYSGQGGVHTNGIDIANVGSGNPLMRNRVYGSVGLGIDLGGDGVTANDAGDADTGANQLQNYPRLTLATTDGSGQFTVRGTFNGSANSWFRIELFADTAADPSGHGEGRTYLGFVDIATDAAGDASFSVTLAANVPAGAFISATATKSNAAYNAFTDTSEFAQSIVAISSVQNTFVVDTADDTLDGDTTSLSTLLASKGADGRISLREAILAANNTANGSGGADRISFQIAGTGVHTITLASVLPTITDTVTIDGTTDDSFAANGSRPAIVIDVNGLVGSNGLHLGAGADGSTIRGLAIRNYTNAAIRIDAGADGNTIAGNWLGGFDAAGNPVAAAGSSYVIYIAGANNVIGGDTAADRNLIAADSSTSTYGVLAYGATATGNRIAGNWFGLNATGTASFAGQQTAVSLQLGAADNRVENNVVGGNGVGLFLSGAGSGNVLRDNLIGLAPDGNTRMGATTEGILVAGGSAVTITGNHIGAASENGIRLTGGVDGAVVQGNRIGTDRSGTAVWGTGWHGIYLASASNTLVGGTGAGEGNVVAYANRSGGGYDGIAVVAGSGNAILGNVVTGLSGNGSLAIDLGNDGVTANDAGDADSGPNERQNFPVLTGATASGGRLFIAGTLDTRASTTYRVEFFASPAGLADGHGPAATFLGAATVTTDANGQAHFAFDSAITLPAGSVVSATATVDLGGGRFGSSSELAANVRVLDAAVIVAPGPQTVTAGGALAIPGLGVVQPGGTATVVLTVQQGTLTLDLGGTRLVGGALGSSSLTISGDVDAIAAALGSLVYRPAAGFDGADALQVSSTDGAGLASNGTVALTVLAVNAAPVLVPAAPSLGTVPDDRPGPVVDVASLLGGRAHDADGDVLGIAITGTGGHGQWQVSTDGGAHWLTVDATEAAPLRLGPDALLRFVPAGGDTSATLTYHAWDGNAVSAAADRATLQVLRLHHAPIGTDTTLRIAPGDHALRREDFGFADPGDTPADQFAAVWIDALPASGTLLLDGVAVLAGQRIDAAALDAGRLVYRGRAGSEATIAFRVQDDGGTAVGGADTDTRVRTLGLSVDAEVTPPPAPPPPSPPPEPPAPAPVPVQPPAPAPTPAPMPAPAPSPLPQVPQVPQPGTDPNASEPVNTGGGSSTSPSPAAPAEPPAPRPSPTLSDPVAPAPEPAPSPAPATGAAPPATTGPGQAPRLAASDAHGQASSGRSQGRGTASGAPGFAQAAAEPSRLRLSLREWADWAPATVLTPIAPPAMAWHGVLRPIDRGGVPRAGDAEDAAQEAAAPSAARASAVTLAVDAGYLAFTGGLVWWTSRTAGLVASLLASTPAWRQLDPVPILDGEVPDDPIDVGDDDGELDDTDDDASDRMFEQDEAPLLR